MKKQNTKKTTHFVIPSRKQLDKEQGFHLCHVSFCCCCCAPQE